MRAALLLLLLAPCLGAAEHESNFGRVILAKCDIIVHGVASAQVTRIGGSHRVEITVERTLHGDFNRAELSMHFLERALLPEGEAVRGLFALKRIGGDGFELVGKPVLMKTGDVEEAEKIAVCRAFLAIEAMPAGADRTDAFWRLLLRHVREGGYPGQNAAIELVFVGRDRVLMVTEERFEELREVIGLARGRLTRQTQEDLRLAMQGMVEGRIKTLKLRRVRRAEAANDRRAAVIELRALVDEFPRAFGNADADLMDAMREREQNDRVARELGEVAALVRLKVREREARERAND